MKQKSKTSLVAFFGMLLSFFSPLAVIVPQASAAADTCVWTGGGTPTVDTVAKTITFDASEAANWSTCDNGAVPETGDMLEFPANLADVDPGDEYDDDYAWNYVVNNDLSGLALEGILLTGDTGVDCAVNDDEYTLSGNAITLSGGVDVQYTGTCSVNSVPSLGLDVTAASNLVIDANLYEQSGTSTIDMGSYDLSFCEVSDADRSTSVYGYTLTTTGDLTFACSTVYATFNTDSVFGDVIVEESALLGGDSLLFGNDPNRTLTFKDGARFSFYSLNSTGDVEFESNIVFVGGGGSTNYCTTNDYAQCLEGQPGRVEVDNYRGLFSNQENNYPDPTTYHSTVLSGAITLSSDTVFELGSDVEITGSLGGSYELGVKPGSRGVLSVASSDNESATPNGTIKPETIEQSLVDQGYDVYLNYGYVGVLSEDEEIDYIVYVGEGATLKGVGTVAGIEVESGGTLAPGNSPGCIVSNGDVVIGGTYEVELGGTTACSGYDQTDVTGDVDITGATLETTLFNNYAPTLNSTYVIINNDGSDDVTGTFSGLTEGATFQIGGNTLRINYGGGDGNDVVLTVTAVPSTTTTAAPAAPDTGISSIISNPFISLFAAVLTITTLYSRKLITTKK